MFELKPSLKLY